MFDCEYCGESSATSEVQEGRETSMSVDVKCPQCGQWEEQPKSGSRLRR